MASSSNSGRLSKESQLLIACLAGNLQQVKGYTPLLYASVGLHSRTILYLMEKSADPAAARDYNATALHYVAAKGMILTFYEVQLYRHF
ncbi:hypothetical protein ACHQM5_001622 [Ranunculus cassubicifolius]